MAEEKKLLLKVKHVDVKFHVRGRVLNAIRDANLDIYEQKLLFLPILGRCILPGQ